MKYIRNLVEDFQISLDNLIKEAEEVGMVVNLYEDFVGITFNLPVEEY